MKLAIITHTNGQRPDLLQRCIESVKVALKTCPDAEHLIIHNNDFGQARVDAFELGYDFVCFVDDDDELIPGVIEKCLKVHQENNVGLVFTNEEIIIDGKSHFRTTTHKYEDICTMLPGPHQLCMYRTELVPVIESAGIETDYVLRCMTIMMSEAIQLPIIGYRRYVQEQRMANNFDRPKALALVKEAINLRTGAIPVHKGT